MTKSLKITFITAEFNKDLTEKMMKDSEQHFLENGFTHLQFQYLTVPGALELPLAAKWAIESGADTVLCFGVVIRGETTHYDEVCRGCTYGLQLLMQTTGVPVIMGVLTTENKAQAIARIDGTKGKKGLYCAKAALSLLSLKNRLCPDKNVSHS